MAEADRFRRIGVAMGSLAAAYLIVLYATILISEISKIALKNKCRLVLPEVNWSSIWVSELQITDVTGGSVVQAYYSRGTTRRGPFTLWRNEGGAWSSVSFPNILQTMYSLDPGFHYPNTSGAMELVTQDGGHRIQAALRTVNSGMGGDCSRTSQALAFGEANTASTGRSLLIQNISNDREYRPSVALYNPGENPVTVEVKIIGSEGKTITSVTQELAGYQMSILAAELRRNTYSKAIAKITVMSAKGRVMASGQTANQRSNDPSAHVAVQGQ